MTLSRCFSLWPRHPRLKMETLTAPAPQGLRGHQVEQSTALATHRTRFLLTDAKLFFMDSFAVFLELNSLKDNLFPAGFP